MNKILLRYKQYGASTGTHTHTKTERPNIPFYCCRYWLARIVHINSKEPRSKVKQERRWRWWYDCYDCNCIIFMFHIAVMFGLFTSTVFAVASALSYHLSSAEREVYSQNTNAKHFQSTPVFQRYVSVLRSFFYCPFSCVWVDLFFSFTVCRRWRSHLRTYKVFDIFYWITYRRIS